jgi:DNA invertase Pin-like site-specific DNA recombinase
MVADDPAINRGTLALMSAQADEQRKRIAESSKEALNDIKQKLKAGIPVVAKSSGRTVTKLGVHKGLTETQQKGNEEQARLARERDRKYLPDIKKLQALGMGYTEIARQFNLLGVLTPAQERRQKSETIGEWYASTVRNIVLRNEEQDK